MPKALRILACALPAVIAAAAAFADQPAIRDYESCMKLVGERPEQALEGALAWEKAGGGHAARHCAAMALAAIGSFAEAADRLESLAWDLPEATPDATRAEVLAQAGQFWLDARQFTKADALFSAAIDLAPRDPELRIDRAMTHAAAARYQDAVIDLSAAILLDPDSADALVLRASAYRHTGRPSEATLDVERALALAPDHPGALLERGILRRQAGDDKGARADWNAVIARHPLDPAAEAARRHLAEMAAGGSAPR